MSPAAPLPPAPRFPSAAVTGAYAGALERLEPAGTRWLSRGRTRRKRWIYAVAATDEVLVAAAVVEGGWFGGAFAWAADRASGAVLMEVSAAGLPWIDARVSDHGRPGAAARFCRGGVTVRIDRDVRGWLLEVDSKAGAIEVALEVERASVPFTFVAAVPRGGLRATEKAAGLAATGRMQVGERSFSLAGGSGGVDVTAGTLARETAWRWAFGTGRVAAGPFGFNLCEGFGVPAGDPGENAAFEGGVPHSLPPASIRPGDSEWRIRSEDGSVDLVFRCLASHRERRNLGVLRTRFTQIAGTFDGTVPGRDGRPVQVQGLPGVVEDHWAVW